MEPETVKPGWQTTEFWMSLGVKLIALLVLFKVIPQGDEATVTEVVSNAITNVSALVAAAVAAWRYIKSRTEVKAAASAGTNFIPRPSGGVSPMKFVPTIMLFAFVLCSDPAYAQEATDKRKSEPSFNTKWLDEREAAEKQQLEKRQREQIGRQVAQQSRAASAGPTEVAAQATQVTGRWADAVPSVVPSASPKRELSRRDRTAMGLTVANMAIACREMTEAGEIESGTPNYEMAVALAVHLKAKNPEPFKSVTANDWDAVIGLIERLVVLAN